MSLISPEHNARAGGMRHAVCGWGEELNPHPTPPLKSPQTSQLWRSWICSLRKISFIFLYTGFHNQATILPLKTLFLRMLLMVLDILYQISQIHLRAGERSVSIGPSVKWWGKYIKTFQGLTSGERTLPPVAPEVIHIQSFLWLLCQAPDRALELS
jgi:hypothetical protein